MTSYLQAGWFTQGTGPKGLRTEVIDGAMDAAGNLLRAGIDGATVLRLALRTRGLISIADPRMLGMPHFGDREREQLMNGLARHADAAPELFAFVADCIERVDNLTDLMAFYLHLTHVARMIELLSVAVRTSPQMALVMGGRAARQPLAKKIAVKGAKPAGAKSTAAKSTSSKKKAISKKPAAKKTVSKKAVSKKAAAKQSGTKKVARAQAAPKKATAKKKAPAKKSSVKKSTRASAKAPKRKSKRVIRRQ